MLFDVIDDFKKNDHNASIICNLPENDTLDLFIQTSEMNELFSKFPELIFVDVTYKTNIEKYCLS